MKAYIASLAVGLLVGVIYALFNVRSPAPPVIALLGLLGILLGEQVPSLIRQAFKIEKSASAWVESKEAQARLAALETPPHTPKGTHHG